MADNNSGIIAITQPCRTCGTVSEGRFICVQCNSLAFCDQCWPKWVLHAPGALGWGGNPHEKADPAVLQRLQQVFEPVRTEADHQRELLEDEDTTWFGFGRDSSGHPIFQDCGRFAAIMGESYTKEVPQRYPQLVSFIGETGAGKSTLIKLLIDRQDRSLTKSVGFRSPVTSSGYDRVPTTGDVHLYADPSSFLSETPLLFADCEGLNGGEILPKSLRGSVQDHSTHRSPGQNEARRNRKVRHNSPRYIAWANTPQTRKREYAVAVLYPRILYSFSDVVVFTLRNPRAFESTVLERLLRWGAASIDKSLNQPVLPHAIIVFNASDGIDESEWDMETATKLLMEEIRGAIFREPALAPYVQSWLDRGKRINTTEELLQCYYATVTVIRIPARGTYMLMDQQAGKLFDLIKSRCATSTLRKRQVRMLANAERFQVYLQAAYDHFTKDLNSPFDFVKEALRHSPVPRDFGGNILSLAISIRDRAKDEETRTDAERIFSRLGPMIASCVMFDAVRQNLMGTAAQLLDDAYSEPCKAALQRFADMHWPCGFRKANSTTDHGRCYNVKVGHNPKGHQNSRGILIGHGGYQSNFHPVLFGDDWIKLIQDHLLRLQNAVFELGQKLPGRTELQLAALIHRERVNDFYSSLGNVADFVSHSACFSCLRELPECALPCGHVLCLSCVQAYGRKTSRTAIEMNRCPLHVREIMADPPWVIPIKPRHSGVRILCLDGAGMRGIVELQVLKAIERVLGSKLPIQFFFDLIVGNGTGGIIALGLGAKNWSVDECTKRFKELSKEAFTPREMTGVPLFQNLASLYHGSVYKSQPFEKALRKTFSEQPLFGGVSSQHEMEMSTRVAVTSMTAMDQQDVVFANYNRPDRSDDTLPYRFIRSEGPHTEIKSWEAARATSAVPPLFKPFEKAETGCSYLDGGVNFNCPAVVADHEANLLWNDMTDSPADILLSIGAGKNIKDADRSKDDPSAPISPVSSHSNSWLPNRTARNGLKPLVANPATRKLDDYLRDDKTWDNFARFKSQSQLSSSTEDVRQRYIRINPALNMIIPKLDEVQKLNELEREAREALQQNLSAVREAAHRLVASTFFFDKDTSSVVQTAAGYECSGAIFCRFRISSDEMKALGGFLRSTIRGDFEPYFLLEEETHRSGARKIPLTETSINHMYLGGYFNIDPIQIRVSKELASTKISLCLQSDPYPSGTPVLPISGFPRQLMSEDRSRKVPLYTRSVLLNSRNSKETLLSRPALGLSPAGDLSLDKLEYIHRLSLNSEVVAELSSEAAVTMAELPAYP